MDKGEVKMIDRKDIFMSGFKSKIGYSFTYKDLNEFEAVIDFYEQQCKKQKEVIDKAIELLGNYKHYSTPDEKQNGDNEDLVNNAFDTLKEVSE